jgi:DNA-binding ferritin-like protein (Dps family)
MTEAESPAEIEAQTPESLEQVRDILFGAQMRTVDGRLSQLDERFRRDLESLRSDVTKQLESQEAWARKQVDSINDKLKAERSRTADDLKALQSDMKAGFKNVDNCLARLAESTSKDDADLRDQVLQLTKTIAQDIKSLSDRLTADLDRSVAELRFEKTDIASLVELFSDMARRLGDQLASADKE